MQFICWAIQIYLIICIVRVIFSWIDVDGSNGWLSSISMLSRTLTEPLFASLRGVLPRPGDLPIDLAPTVVILLLLFLRTIVCSI
jgi:uncharacterized protein YggT (Ycf19 family)